MKKRELIKILKEIRDSGFNFTDISQAWHDLERSDAAIEIEEALKSISETEYLGKLVKLGNRNSFIRVKEVSVNVRNDKSGTIFLRGPRFSFSFGQYYLQSQCVSIDGEYEKGEFMLIVNDGEVDISNVVVINQEDFDTIILDFKEKLESLSSNLTNNKL